MRAKREGEKDAPSSGSQPNAMLFFFMPLRPQPSEPDDEEDEEDEPVEDDAADEAVLDDDDHSTEVELALPSAAPTKASPADAEPEAWMLEAILEW